MDKQFEIDEIYEKLSDANKERLLIISEKLCRLQQCYPTLDAAVKELNQALYSEND